MPRPTLLTVIFALASAGGAAAGDLTIRFKYDGPPPEPAAIEVNKDVEFCGKHNLVDESLLVNPENNGIKNVVVYVYTGRGGSEIEPVEPARKTHTLASSNCRFDPHILVMQAGDTLRITYADRVGHNANVNFLRNDAAGLMVPAKGSHERPVPYPEPAPLPVECNIHPWMKAYIFVLEHPFVGVSNEDGELVIKDLPEKELIFRVWVEAAVGPLDRVKVNGEVMHWPRNRFKYRIKPGPDDMGTITLTAKQLGR